MRSRWEAILACWLLAYPLYWASGSLVNLAFRLVGMRLPMVASVALPALVWLALRRVGWVGGLALVFAAWWPLGRIVPFAMRRGWPPGWQDIAAVAVASVAMYEGLKQLRLRGWWLVAAMVPSAIALPLVEAGRRGPLVFVLLQIAPLVLATLIAMRIKDTPAAAPVWRPAILAAVVALALGGGSEGAIRWREESRRAEEQRLVESLRREATPRDYPKLFFQRGVSFTAEAGVRYGSEESRKMLEQLTAYGVNAVALVPYGFGGRGSLRIQKASPGSWESDTGVEILTGGAHRLGMTVLLKPHVWRVRQQDLSTPELRAQWFEEFTGFIEHYARPAARIHADVFCVGTEFGWLAQFESEWRAVIARVRALYPGPIVYAATQGPEFETIRFWDALDYIGLDNYYPLGEGYSTTDALKKIEEVQRRFQKPVLFTEAGFSAIEGAHRAPWEDETRKPLSLEEQTRCYQALLETFYAKPWFHGVYWWKVGTNGYGGPANNSMTPWRKPAMEIVKRWYLSGQR